MISTNLIQKISIFFVFFVFCACQYQLSAKDTVDIMRPLITKYNYCSEYMINVSDNRQYQINSDTFQLDLGINDPPNVYSTLSYNFSDIYESTFEDNKINYEFSFRMKVEDPFQDAKAIFVVYDATKKNHSFDSLIYKAEKLQINPTKLMFAPTYIGTNSIFPVNIDNISKSNIHIKSIRLKNANLFKINNNISNYILEANGVLQVLVTYNPISDIYFDKSEDSDTLIIETNCLNYTIPISGRGVESRIIADDFDFGAVEINTSLCSGDSGISKLKIHNPGTGLLSIKGFYPLSENSPFSIANTTTALINNLTINPKSSVALDDICFNPTEIGEFIEPLVFKNNSDGPDSIAYLRGIAYLPGPHFNSHNFGKIRLGDSNTAEIIIKNSADHPITISDIILSDSNSTFRILYDESTPKIDRISEITLYPSSPIYANELQEVKVRIEFKPTEEKYYEVKLVPIFPAQSEYKTNTVFNYIRGAGFLPKIQAKGYNFLGKTQVNTRHHDNGYISISSTSQSSSLYLKEINIIPLGLSDLNDFIPMEKLPSDTIIKTNQDLRIPIIFIPRDAGEREALVEIISDAYSGGEGTKWDTTIVYLRGEGFNKILYIEPLELEGIAHCEINQTYFKVKNISDSTEAYIFDIVKFFGDTNAFTFNLDTLENNFVILQPKDSVFLSVKFDASNFLKDNFSIVYRVVSDVDTSTGIIRAYTKRYETIISLPNISSVMPGTILRYNPPKSHSPNFNIDGDFRKVVDVAINSLSIDIQYKKNELMFLDTIELGDLLTNWNIGKFYTYDIDKNYSILHIEASGSDALDSKIGTLLKPLFLTLLSDSSNIETTIKNISFQNSDNCLDIISNNGNINLSYCSDEVRNVVISQDKFNISKIGANPIYYGENSIIDYTIPYDTHTSIEIYNSFGEKIKTIIDDELSAGTYTYNLDNRSLSSGTYFLQMTAGPYHNTIKLIIMK